MPKEVTAPRRKYAPRMAPAERREQLLDATLHLIVEDGYGGVTMEAVAREAGVTKPVVYDAFGTRGRLLRALLQREEERALAALAAMLPEQPGEIDPDQLLVDGVRMFLETVHGNPDAWRLMLLPVEGTPEEVRTHVAAGREAVARQLEALVLWGIQRRGGPENIDVELAAQAIMALGEHVGRLALTEPERFDTERIARFLSGLMVNLARGE